jgi:hypothetical protein
MPCQGRLTGFRSRAADAMCVGVRCWLYRPSGHGQVYAFFRNVCRTACAVFSRHAVSMLGALFPLCGTCTFRSAGCSWDLVPNEITCSDRLYLRVGSRTPLYRMSCALTLRCRCCAMWGTCFTGVPCSICHIVERCCSACDV